ncbi:hypothetical protein GCM10009616_01150 [Microlunatus lacustris]
MGSPAGLISTTDSSVTVIGCPFRSNGCGGPDDLPDPRRPRPHSSEDTVSDLSVDAATAADGWRTRECAADTVPVQVAGSPAEESARGQTVVHGDPRCRRRGGRGGMR